MSKSARSVFIFGVYLLLLGGTLMVAPNFLLGIFRVPATTEGWIRTTGMLIFLLGTYYILAARQEIRAFFQWTVYIRPSVIFFLTAFFILGYTHPNIILLGVVDFLGAIWTALALRSEAA